MPDNIIATVFGGKKDRNTSAYNPHQLLDDESFYVALPWRFPGKRPWVKVTGPGGSALAEILDVGPWNVNDPYWVHGERPAAERGSDARGRRTNRAGIDLSPALARAVGIDGMGVVDWEFYTEDTNVVTPVRRVLDLSHHNTIPTMEDFDRIKEAGIWGIIHKATESTNFRDDAYINRRNAFLERGFLWGAYHFFHPGNVGRQVDYFLNYAGLDDATLYALDWEASSSGTANMQDAINFCELMEDKTGRKCVIYSGNVAKEKINGVNEYLGSHRLWLAQYGTNPTTQASWHGEYWLWQYSDGVNGPGPHGCPGVSGEVDTNSFTGTQDELAAEWSGTGTAPVPPEPVPPEEVPEVSMTVSADMPVRLTIVKGDNVT